MEKEFSKVLGLIIAGSLAVVIICAAIGQCKCFAFIWARRNADYPATLFQMAMISELPGYECDSTANTELLTCQLCAQAFMMQTNERDPLYAIIAILGFLNLGAAAFVVLFIKNVPWKAVPRSARMLVVSFLVYFLTTYVLLPAIACTSR